MNEYRKGRLNHKDGGVQKHYRGNEVHDHDHGHAHDHTTEVRLFIAAVVAFVLARFVPVPAWLAASLHVATVFLAGYHVMYEGFVDTYRDSKAAGTFRPNTHLLVALAATAAILIGEFSEASLVVLIFAGAHYLENYAKEQSQKEITSLLRLNPSSARRIQANGELEEVDVSALAKGDMVRVLRGDQVPVDGEVTRGLAVLDTMSITGESVPEETSPGSAIYGGTINVGEAFDMRVTTSSEETVFSQILKVVESSQKNLSPVAQKLKQWEPRYVTTVLLAVPLVFVVSRLVTDWTLQESLYRAVVVLVSSSPCALAAASIPTNLSAISNLARNGILFRGGDDIANFADIHAIAFDKTGTLTEGRPQVTDYHFEQGELAETYLPIIVAMESSSNHPLAEAVVEAFGHLRDHQLTLDVENQIGSGLNADYQGRHYSIGKRTDEDELSPELAEHYANYAQSGKTPVLFRVDGEVAGLFAFLDLPTEEARQTIHYLNDQDIQTYMLTGDNAGTAQAVAEDLGIEHYYADILPEEKAVRIEEIRVESGLTAMVGDGVNDAPALVTADIGFAMGEGTDVAIEVADGIITNNRLSKLIYAHRIARKMNRVVLQNIAIALFVVVVLNLSNLLGGLKLATSIIFHEGSTILVIVNGLRLLRQTE
ncbi:heavy metal translocating P-type ATPase [Suicoccus acidiformans]|uniref:Heavy metal translocating P-type ATPase n=1 Tax=Suicoccus acidiformans TaxID=2036206 RepID=A0A347WKY1_9LACT|nr:heavy metal translocating P-type ATPase [Suicoccus acidiformans]AXY25738.1 heavy metal translocating P-type ATPase [Suicoccus acidiformans]